jgi:hypothetical protein
MKSTDDRGLLGFYRGVVEDNKDPEKRGRCRVRLWGLHTALKTKTDNEGIPTAELPWASPVLPIVEGGITGYGMWSVPVQGSHVMCFFEQGHLLQLRYFGVLPGLPTIKAPTPGEGDEPTTGDKTGFFDPDGVNPRDDRLNEPDYHRLSRGVKEKTSIEEQDKHVLQGFATAGGGNFSEPKSPYKAEYPHNFVIATHGGITVELDSTKGSERVRIFHPKGSYIEIGPDGMMVIRSAKRIDIVQGSHQEGATEDRDISAKGQVNIYGAAAINMKGGVIRMNDS